MLGKTHAYKLHLVFNLDYFILNLYCLRYVITFWWFERIVFKKLFHFFNYFMLHFQNIFKESFLVTPWHAVEKLNGRFRRAKILHIFIIDNKVFQQKFKIFFWYHVCSSIVPKKFKGIRLEWKNLINIVLSF